MQKDLDYLKDILGLKLIKGGVVLCPPILNEVYGGEKAFFGINLDDSGLATC
jgi:hypothetical protein